MKRLIFEAAGRRPREQAGERNERGPRDGAELGGLLVQHRDRTKARQRALREVFFPEPASGDAVGDDTSGEAA